MNLYFLYKFFFNYIAFYLQAYNWVDEININKITTGRKY